MLPDKLVADMDKFLVELIHVAHKEHGVQRKMISVDIFVVFLILLFFALLLLFVT